MYNACALTNAAPRIMGLARTTPYAGRNTSAFAHAAQRTVRCALDLLAQRHRDISMGIVTTTVRTAQP